MVPAAIAPLGGPLDDPDAVAVGVAMICPGAVTTTVLVGPIIEVDPLWVVSGAGAGFGFGEGEGEGDEGSLEVVLAVEVLDESLVDEVAAADGLILDTALSSPVSWTDQNP